MQARSPSHPNGQGQGTRTPRYIVRPTYRIHPQQEHPGPWWIHDTREDISAGACLTEFEAHMKCAVLNAEHDDAVLKDANRADR